MDNQYNNQDGSAAAAAAAAVFNDMQQIHPGLRFDNVDMNGAYRQGPPQQVSQAYTQQQHAYFAQQPYGQPGQQHNFNSHQQFVPNASQQQPQHQMQQHHQHPGHPGGPGATGHGPGNKEDFEFDDDGEFDPNVETDEFGGSIKHNMPKQDLPKRKRGRPPGSRRRKATPELSEEDEDDESLFMRGEVKTKSGRRVAKPDAYDPAMKHPSKRRGRPPGPRQDPALMCMVCGTGQSKPGNPIVFCDGCNRGWHQLCHVPTIDDIVTQLPDAEWYCGSCELKRARKKRKLEMGSTGEGLSEEERKTYLASLPPSHMIQLIMFAESQHPDLPIYPPEIRQWLVDNHQKKLEDQEAIDARLNAVFAEPEPTPEPEPLPPPQPRMIPAAINTPTKIAYPSAYSNLVTGTDENGSPSTLPSYEEMIVKALMEIGEPQGTPPRVIYDWMNSNYPLQSNFKASASQALQKTVKKGRLLKDGSLYRLNTEFTGSTSPNRKATRKPSVYREHPVYSTAGVGDGSPSIASQDGVGQAGGDSSFTQDPGDDADYAVAAAAAAAAANHNGLAQEYMQHVEQPLEQGEQLAHAGGEGDAGDDSTMADNPSTGLHDAFDGITGNDLQLP